MNPIPVPAIKLLAHPALLANIPASTVQAFHTFTEFSARELGLTRPVTVRFMPRPGDDDTYTTGHYNPITGIILARYEDRAPVDICRTVAHELVHQSQDERGALNFKGGIPDIGGPIEDEANAVAGELIKKFVKEHNARWIYDL